MDPPKPRETPWFTTCLPYDRYFVIELNFRQSFYYKNEKKCITMFTNKRHIYLSVTVTQALKADMRYASVDSVLHLW